ncbi:DNA alkylation repair protein [Maribacter algarum]|uniref:DNA alkylation repair protein n=1 Tax=Maribacter algarum (ex Zhang et al. 2020) TaxID=2578118 RepID=A0A5S3PW60_9FLAO|nr:DNA alkylation repair protein [Maribacter algarum]TMM59256.1 DNA alkylation repair protein [Maribacter algarum]
MVDDFITTLTIEFQKNANRKIASEQKAYMRGQFDYYGIKTPQRRKIQKPFLVKQFLPEKKEAIQIVKLLWSKPQRDYHYVAQELMLKYSRQMTEDDITVFEFMVTHKSWWDTVDFIATKLMGTYFKKYPEKRKNYVEKWLKSGNTWLQRSALLFQLKYKEELDTQILSIAIEGLLESKEFFINKAIGWVLRDYSRVNPDWVWDYVNDTSLNNLSKREALRLIN